MPGRKRTYWDYFWKTLFWVIGNLAFGLFPLIFMGAVYIISGGKIYGDAIQTMIYEGIILFVCIAIMGAVFIDYALSGILMNRFKTFSVYSIPAFVVFLVAINFFLIHLKIIDKTRFSLASSTTISVIVLSLFYSVFVKASLYIFDDIRHKP